VLTRESESALVTLFGANPSPTSAQILAAVAAVDGAPPVAPISVPRLSTDPQPRLVGLM